MNSQFYHDLERSIQEYRPVVDAGRALERLLVNRDFKEVVLNGYLEKEAIRLVHLKARPDMQDATAQKAILTQLDSVGCFQQFLFGVRTDAEMAGMSLEAAENTRDELLAEGS